jgi:hypothetical protein
MVCYSLHNNVKSCRSQANSIMDSGILFRHRLICQRIPAYCPRVSMGYIPGYFRIMPPRSPQGNVRKSSGVNTGNCAVAGSGNSERSGITSRNVANRGMALLTVYISINIAFNHLFPYDRWGIYSIGYRKNGGHALAAVFHIFFSSDCSGLGCFFAHQR